MTNTETSALSDIDPTGWKTPKTASRTRRGIDLPATVTVNDDGTETVNRLVGVGLRNSYQSWYKVAAGWGRIAVEQEIEIADAKLRRRWTVLAAATDAVFALPGYSEDA